MDKVVLLRQTPLESPALTPGLAPPPPPQPRTVWVAASTASSSNLGPPTQTSEIWLSGGVRTDDWSGLWVPLWSQRTGLGSVRSPTRLKADGLGSNQLLGVLELLLNAKLLSEVPIWRQSGPVRTGSKLSASKTNTRHQRLHSAQTHTHTHTLQAEPARAGPA